MSYRFRTRFFRLSSLVFFILVTITTTIGFTFVEAQGTRPMTAQLNMFIESMVNLVRKLGDEVAKREAGMRERVLQNDCGSRCSLNLCGEEFLNTECMMTGINSNSVKCGASGNGTCGFTQIDTENSGIRIPGNGHNHLSSSNLDAAKEICMSEGLEDLFKEVNNFTQSSSFIPWTYLAFVRSGVLRIWPAMPWESDMENGPSTECAPFDPRTRLWYKSSISEKKNLVIVVEASEVMQQPFLENYNIKSTRWDESKTAINSLLDSLTEFDYVGLVVFNDIAKPVLAKTLIKAKTTTIDLAKQELDKIQPSGGADIQEALDAALKLFETKFYDTIDNDGAAGCQNIIYFIGTSEPKEDNGIQKTLEKFEKRRQEIERKSTRVAIFSASMDVDASFARQLACRSNGSWSILNGRDSHLNTMATYFQYVAFSVEPDASDASANGNIVATTIYEDANGLGKINTYVKRIFVNPRCAVGNKRNFTKSQLFLGLVARDVRLREYEALGFSEKYVNSKLESLQSKTRCEGSYDYSLCKLQILRGSKAECLGNYWTEEVNPCHEFKNKTYFVGTNRTDFKDAEGRCTANGGHLVEIDSSIEQHFLATIVPPDGAWIGMQVRKLNGSHNTEWAWLQSGERVGDSSIELWIRNPNKAGDCKAGFIDPRGTHNNVGGANCRSQKAYVCRFDFKPTKLCPEKIPGWEEGELDYTAKACSEDEGECSDLDEVQLPEKVVSGLLCSSGVGKTPRDDLICCPNSQSRCMGKEGSDNTILVVVIVAAVLIIIIIIIIIVLIRRKYGLVRGTNNTRIPNENTNGEVQRTIEDRASDSSGPNPSTGTGCERNLDSEMIESELSRAISTGGQLSSDCTLQSGNSSHPFSGGPELA